MKRKSLLIGIITAISMFVMILDGKTAANSAAMGVELCIRTVIPSLFPFFILSGMINSCLLGQKISFLRPAGKLCKLPAGTESLLLLGFLAGYPVGAQLITQACREGKLSRAVARRMLGFCNNAGPAFLFGMLAPLFSSIKTVWFLWSIHILAALLTGCFLPADNASQIHLLKGKPITPTQALQRALRAMATVCGWVIIFRVILGFCQRWFLWYFPTTVQILFSGFLELANGCISLAAIPTESTRFLLAGIMLAFGGVCVGMQTVSVTEEIGTGYYFPGKIVQAILSFLFCALAIPLLF